MRMEMNLATHPFGRSRLFWLASGVAALVLAKVSRPTVPLRSFP